MTERRGNNAGDLAVPFAPDRLVAVKERLQFTGWLQYLIPLAFGIGLTGIGSLAMRVWPTGWLLAPGLLLIARGLFDIVVVKLGLVALPDRTPRPVTGDAFAVMKARRACRSFQRRPLSDADRAFVLDRVDHHTETGRAGALTDMPVRAELIDAPLTVWPVVGAQQFLAVIGPADYDRLAVIESGRALQHVVLDLTERGIATCWIGPGADRTSVESALGQRFDAHRDHVLCVIAIGYSSHWKPFLARVMALVMHRRRALSDLVFDGAPGVPARLDRAPLRRLRPVFEACRWAPSSYNSQTTRAVVEIKDKSLIQVSFCALEDSRYYAPLAEGIWVANWERGVAALGLAGRLAPCPEPFPIAGGLIHDLDWRP